MHRTGNEDGYALITVLLLVALVMTLLASYFTITNLDLASASASMRTVRALYASEAGLNVRLSTLRALLLAPGLPGGAGPNTGSGYVPCASGNLGSGDLACTNHTLQNRTATSYVEELPGNPHAIVIARGELFQNRRADEFRYTIGSISVGPENRREAALATGVASRRVPLFQFAAFYGKDLEIGSSSSMAFAGPIHTNGDLYLNPAAGLDVGGQLTVAGTVYRGPKHQSGCVDSSVRVLEPDDLVALPACSGSRAPIAQATLNAWAGMIRTSVPPVVVPSVQELDAAAGNLYWDRADLRIVLDLHGTPVIEVRQADGTVDLSAGTALNGCAAVAHLNTLYNQREAAFIEMLNVDIRALLGCIHSNSLLGVGIDIDETSDGGLVLYLGVDGPASAGPNHYGVRVRNGAELVSSVGLAPAIAGLTIVTDQAFYLNGSYNTVNKKPAAILADSFNVLSSGWNDAYSAGALAGRVATSTTIQAAVLAGTDSTAGIEGAAGQNLGGYNGGLENFIRLHESWTGRTLTFRGSLVSLDAPRHVDGAWSYGSPYYEAPAQNWDYDAAFDDPSRLPPLTPTFTYADVNFQLGRYRL